MSTQSTKPNFKIGELLVKEGYLTMDALNKVLDMQRQQKNSLSQEYKPFGQICIDLNLISREELQRFLKRYEKRIYIGELLMNMGLITPKHVEFALTQQAKDGQKFGQILVTNNIITESQLTDALSMQLDVPRIIPSLELIDKTLLQGLPEEFLTEHQFLPVFKDGRTITVVMGDPDNKGLIRSLEQTFNANISAAIASPTDILRTIREHFHGHAPADPAAAASGAPATAPTAPSKIQVGDTNLNENQQTQQDNSVVSFLLTNALKDRATDIHVEPQEKHIRIRYRIDGVLHHKTDLPAKLASNLISRLKQLCGLNPENTHTSQEGSTSGNVMGKDIKLEISTYPSLWGEKMVVHLKEKDSATQSLLLNLDRIGFSPLYLQRYQGLLTQPGGITIMTGPANTGKSMTLYASVNYLNQQNRSIITVEDPIECVVPGTVQGSFAKNSTLSYAQMLAAAMRQDPDILMVSEIRDGDTMQAIVEAALTGCKVMTTFRSFDATGAMLRLMELGLQNYLVSSSNLTVISQRLVRRLCDNCKAPAKANPNILKQLGLVGVDPNSYDLYRPVGCPECNGRGFKGQTAIHEVLVINEAIREALQARKPAATIRGIARTEAKLVSMAEDGLYKAIEGITSLEEVQRVAFVNEYDSQTPWEAEEIYSICTGMEPEFL